MEDGERSERFAAITHPVHEDFGSMSSYSEYLSHKPFINDDYRRPATQHLSALPESNRQAVISALKNLQDKIRKLEVERSTAENNLRHLATETSQYREILQRGQRNEEARQTTVSRQTQELESQLTSAETRCKLLEKQLDYMRRMVQTAEQDRDQAVTKAVSKEKQKEESSNAEYRTQLDKLSQLEREHLKLTATQSLAQGKIRELEGRLQSERYQRHYIEEKAAEFDTATDGNNLLRPSSAKPKKMVKKKKKKEKVVRPTRTRPRTASEPTRHFRLNLAEIPFVAGQSTTPSHSVGANVQKVISLMKSHNLALCSSLPSSSSSLSSGPDSDTDLTDLLLQLQDEFGEMSFEHQELMRQMTEASFEDVRQDLERELDNLVGRMEAKSQQITKVRKHQELLDTKTRKKKSRPKSAMASLPSQRNNEVEVTTTIKTKGSRGGRIKLVPPTGKARSLSVLKDMKKLQTSLRREDVCWEK